MRFLLLGDHFLKKDVRGQVTEEIKQEQKPSATPDIARISDEEDVAAHSVLIMTDMETWPLSTPLLSSCVIGMDTRSDIEVHPPWLTAHAPNLRGSCRRA